jgi:chromosomal replication initiator protein
MYTLDMLEADGAAMALSARPGPRAWPRQGWPRRLVNQLVAGLWAQITPPGLASRRRYVLQHASRHGVTLKAEAVETLAQAADGYRTFEGWISRLGLEARLKSDQEGRGVGKVRPRARQRLHVHPQTLSGPLDPCTVALIVAEETVLAKPLVTVHAIARRVAAGFGVWLNVLRGPSHRASVDAARHKVAAQCLNTDSILATVAGLEPPGSQANS